jgi:hypothetical protein
MKISWRFFICIVLFERIKYLKKPDWLKEKVEQETTKEELKFVYEVFELFKIDANAEDIFKSKFKYLKYAKTKLIIFNLILLFLLQEKEIF